jgi:hypothetical protein
MTDQALPGSAVAGPGFPRVALGLTWLVSLLATGALGWLVHSPARWLPLGLTVLGLVATGAVLSNKRRSATLAFSTVASVVLVAGGVVTAVLAGGTRAGVLAAVAPVLGGVIAFRLTDRAREMSR